MRITHYRAAWNAAQNVGEIELFDYNGPVHTLQGVTYTSFAALVDLLRNEAPIEFDPATGWLSTAKERVGEEEGD